MIAGDIKRINSHHISLPLGVRTGLCGKSLPPGREPFRNRLRFIEKGQKGSVFGNIRGDIKAAEMAMRKAEINVVIGQRL